MKAKQLTIAMVLFFTIFGFSGASQAVPIKTDIVFIIDATGSMAGEIAGVRNGFSSFVAGLDANAVDARFAIVLIGGTPELIQDFTSDTTATQNTLNSIQIGSNPGVHNNHNVNPEAGLEAVRMALGAAPQSEFANNNIPQDGTLDYRSDARKNIILATDEDSDRPGNAANRLPGQTTNEPPSSGEANVNWPNWQAEVDAAAQAIIDNEAFINMLVNAGDPPSQYQYGNPGDDVSDPDLLNYDPDATLANLLADPVTDDSLQAQVLEAGLVARTFNIAGANDPNFVDNFFAAKVEEIITDPGVTVPEPSTLALMGIGLAGIGFARKRRKA